MPHYHNFEETITLPTGRVEAPIDGITELVTAPATLFIPPHTIHSLTNLHREPAHLFAFLATKDQTELL